ncbi:MAG: hypothetical protein II894_08660 [Bacteroidales bacterium]|nr:hypothetical protein [Bacteroidales bacterium]
MSLFNKTKPQNEPAGAMAISAEELKAQIDQNRFSGNDTVEQLFGKYDILCLLEMKNLDKPQKTMVQQAKLLFVNSLQPPKEDKQEVLNFITYALLYVRPSAQKGALQSVSKLAFSALKTATKLGTDLGGFGEVMELVEESDLMNGVGKIVNKYIHTQAGELVNVWRQKLDAAFANAKKLEKETLSTDKEFSDRLADLRKQYKSA